MPEISKIKLPSGSTYDIKDSTARAAIANIHTFNYAVCTQASDTPYDVTWKSGATTIIGTLAASADTMYKIYLVPQDNAQGDYYDEYITANPSGTTYNWEKFGSTQIDIDNLGDFAYADTATVTFTGNTTDTFAKTVNVTAQPTVELTANSSTSTGAAAFVESLSESGTNNVTFTTSGNTANAITALPTSTVPKASGVTKYVKTSVTAGSTSKLVKATKYVAASATGGGSVTAGTAASLSMTMGTGDNAETLNISWTANTPTAVTLPSFSSQDIATGSLSSTGTGDAVKTGDPTVSLASSASSSTGAIAYTESVSESGTNNVTFGTPTTVSVLKDTVSATVPKTVGTTKYMKATASGTAVGVATSATAITALGTGQALPDTE